MSGVTRSTSFPRRWTWIAWPSASCWTAVLRSLKPRIGRTRFVCVLSATLWTSEAPGGLIADLARAYDDHDYLLIADGAQLLTHPLIPAVAAIAQETADVAILTDMEGTPSGLTLVRCGALREVSSVGFVDLKEQALPALARSHRVQAVRWNGGIGHSVRSMDEYIAALRHWHRQHVDGPQALASDEASPFQEDWCHSFALVEPMADVSPQAVIHDSVILSGARVEPGAVVVRSIVCPGGVVSAKSEAVETLVAQH